MNVYKKHLDVTHLQEIKLPITKIETILLELGYQMGNHVCGF